MRGLDPINCITWASITLAGCALYWWLLSMFVPMLLGLFADAGSLNGCEALSPAECSAYAQEGL